MVLRLNKISNIGIIDIKNALDLTKYTLIYGFNGTGKTTISRLFTLLGNGYDEKLIKKITLPNAITECKINDKNFPLDSQQNFNTDFDKSFIFFNKDFVEKNVLIERGLEKIFISVEGGYLDNEKRSIQDCKTRIALEQKSYVETKDYIVNGDAFKGINGLDKKKEEIIRNIKNNKTTYASQIKEIIGGKLCKSYQINRLDDDISSLEQKIPLTKQDNNYKEGLNFDELKNDILARKNKVDAVKEKIPDSELDTLGYLKNKIGLLKELPTSLEVLLNYQEELSTDDFTKLADVIKDWLEDGLEIHKTHNNSNKCFFCDNKLGDRLQFLETKFSANKRGEIKQKLASIKHGLEEARTIFLNIQANKNIANKDNTSLIGEFGKAKDSILLIYGKVLKIIESKESELSKPISIWSEELKRDSFVYDIENAEKIITNLINSYNAYNLEVDNAETIREEKYKSLVSIMVIWFVENSYNGKSHKDLSDYLDLISNKIKDSTEELRQKIIQEFNTPSVSKFNLTIKEGENFLHTIPSSLNLKLQEIQEKAANIRLSIKSIEDYFKKIIQTTNLELKDYVEDGATYFKVKRNGIDAIDTLSEGEKTALAFAYFLTKLKENPEIKDNQKTLVIDDPISSLDYNVLYAIYNLIYHKIYKTAESGKEDVRYGGIIILTHNWYFANLVYNGIIKTNTPRTCENCKEDESISGEGCFYEIVRNTNGCSSLIKGKKKFLENEYKYLFERIVSIYKSLEKNEDEDVDLYGLGNTCRRFAELFCQFYNKDSHLNSLLSEDNGLSRFLHLSSHEENFPDKYAIEHTPQECLKHIKSLFTTILHCLNDENKCGVRTTLKNLKNLDLK